MSRIELLSMVYKTTALPLSYIGKPILRDPEVLVWILQIQTDTSGTKLLLLLIYFTLIQKIINPSSLREVWLLFVYTERSECASQDQYMILTSILLILEFVISIYPSRPILQQNYYIKVANSNKKGISLYSPSIVIITLWSVLKPWYYFSLI